MPRLTGRRRRQLHLGKRDNLLGAGVKRAIDTRQLALPLASRLRWDDGRGDRRFPGTYAVFLVGIQKLQIKFTLKTWISFVL
jgi:uncharacterized protein (DUF952 family)